MLEVERANERVMRNAVVRRARLGEFVTASGGYLRRGCIPRSNPFFSLSTIYVHHLDVNIHAGRARARASHICHALRSSCGESK